MWFVCWKDWTWWLYLVSNRSVDESSSLKHITRLKKLFVVRITRRDEAVSVVAFSCLWRLAGGWTVGWMDGWCSAPRTAPRLLRGDKHRNFSEQSCNIQPVSKCKFYCGVCAEIYLVVQWGTELKLMLLCFGNKRDACLFIYACFVGCNSMESEIIQGLYVVYVGCIAPKKSPIKHRLKVEWLKVSY